MNYTLFNKELKRKLIHPSIGLWFTNDLKEAQDMLIACKEHLRLMGLDTLVNNFVIIDADTGEEIL